MLILLAAMFAVLALVMIIVSYPTITNAEPTGAVLLNGAIIGALLGISAVLLVVRIVAT